MERPKISIIVSAYNIEDYIGACLDSVIKQSYKNLEIIVIDDGSTDGTPKLIDNYAKQDERIKVVHQDNVGLSATRNTGINLATSDYVCLVDGDDMLLPDYAAKLLSRLEHTHADIAVCGYETLSDKPEESHITYHQAETTTGHDAARNLLLTLENIDVVTWNKIYKRSLFTENNIYYPVGDVHEDTLTTYKLYAVAKKVTYLMEPLYRYYRRKGSIMDKASIISRIMAKERAGTEAVDFFATYEASLRGAAHVSILLAQFAYVDAALRGEIPAKRGEEALRWIRSHTMKYLRNNQLTHKLRTYLFMVNTPNSGLYRAFRKIIPGPRYPQ